MQDTQMIGPNGEIYRPTLTPTPGFNPDADAQALEKAMKGFGTDEKAIINVFARRTPSERAQIVKVYKTSFGKDLPTQLEKETSGNFKKCLKYLCMDDVTLKATILRNAIKGAGTDEQALIYVICSATNSEIAEIRAAYKRMFDKDLEKDVKGDTSGFFQRLLVALLQGERKQLTPEQTARIFSEGVDSVLDRGAAQEMAKQLYNAGEDKLGTDESTFIRILVRENVWQLAAIDAYYRGVSKKSLRDAVKSETSSDFGKALTAALDFSLDRPATFATFLHKAMKGLGTDDDTLSRIIVMRAHIDMMEIKMAYQKLFNRTLAQDIKGDCSGDYERVLLTLIGEA